MINYIILGAIIIILWLLYKRRSISLRDALIKKIKVEGVIFHIKKINPLDHLDGSKILMQKFSEYKINKNDKPIEFNKSKIYSHYKDIIMAGVVKPKLTRDKNEIDAIHVDEVMNDWLIVNQLYNEIIEFTYGKKKTFTNLFQDKGY